VNFMEGLEARISQRIGGAVHQIVRLTFSAYFGIKGALGG